MTAASYETESSRLKSIKGLVHSWVTCDPNHSCIITNGENSTAIKIDKSYQGKATKNAAVLFVD
jgi:hypothetical protein